MIQSTMIRLFILLTLTLGCGKSGTGGGEGGLQNETPPIGSDTPTTPATEPEQLKAALDVTVFPITHSPENCSDNLCTFVMTFTNVGNYPMSGLELACNFNPWGVFDNSFGSTFPASVNPGEIKQLSCTYNQSMAPGPDLELASIVLSYTSTPNGTRSKYTYRINR